MGDAEVKKLLDMIDGSGSEIEASAISKLRKLDINFPLFLLKKYRESKSWKVRCACVSNAIRYARTSNEAIQLGVEAISDKSKVVVHFACMLLAFSLKKELLFNLIAEEKKAKDDERVSDIRAAIDAIKNENSNYFADRDHSGKIILNIL